MKPTVEALLDLAREQIGKPYVYGAEAKPGDHNPIAFDCSELVEWLCRELGLFIPDGSMEQLRHCRGCACEIPVKTALETPGALLFREPKPKLGPHVAISLGNGKTIEARGREDGVGEFDAVKGRIWTAAALIPGLEYPGAPDDGSGSSLRA